MITIVQYCDSDGSYCINRMHDITADTTYILTADDTSTLMDGRVIYVIRPYLKHYTRIQCRYYKYSSSDALQLNDALYLDHTEDIKPQYVHTGPYRIVL